MMQLDWSTFILEIVNFLILVWVLSRFFYRPVMNIIAMRREDIKKQMLDAGETCRSADELKQKYEARLQDWEQEKAEARSSLHEEIDKERKLLMEQLHRELDQERHRENVINQRRLETERLKNERMALEQGAAFSARLLSRLADPALETAILRLFLEDLAALAPAQQQLLKSACGDNNNVSVTSAYPLDENGRDKVEKTLSDIIGKGIQCKYTQDPLLIAGLRIAIGSRLLQATIRDELNYFIGGEHAPR